MPLTSASPPVPQPPNPTLTLLLLSPSRPHCCSSTDDRGKLLYSGFKLIVIFKALFDLLGKLSSLGRTHNDIKAANILVRAVS